MVPRNKYYRPLVHVMLRVPVFYTAAGKSAGQRECQGGRWVTSCEGMSSFAGSVRIDERAPTPQPLVLSLRCQCLPATSACRPAPATFVMAPGLSGAVLKKIRAVGSTLQKKDNQQTVALCIDYIKKHPDEADMLHIVLSSGMLPQLARASAREPIPPCSTHFSLLSLRLTKRILSDLRPDWDGATLKTMHTADSKQLIHALCFGIGCELESPIPHEFVDQLLDHCRSKCKEFGNRIKDLTVSQAKLIGFEASGEYSFHRATRADGVEGDKTTHTHHAHPQQAHRRHRRRHQRHCYRLGHRGQLVPHGAIAQAQEDHDVACNLSPVLRGTPGHLQAVAEAHTPAEGGEDQGQAAQAERGEGGVG